MKFQVVAEVFESIESKSKRLEIMDLVADAFEKAVPSETAQLAYLLQGKLGPDFASINAGMGDKFVAQAVSKVSGFSVSDVTAHYKKLGDLGLVAQAVLEKRTQQAFFSQPLELKKVFDNLQKIATTTGAGSQDSKIRLLAELLNSASPLEAKFLVRIPLEQLRLGLGDSTIMDGLALNLVDAFAEQNRVAVMEAEEAITVNQDTKPEAWADERRRRLRQRVRELIEAKYNVHPDLGFIAKLLKEKGLAGLSDVGIVPGIPIRPTLAERLPSAEEIFAKLGDCIVEAKYDGFRLQCHKQGDQVWIFSRKNESVTKMFPEIVEAIRTHISADSAVLEAEAIAFNEQTQEFFPFQVTIQRKRKHGVAEKSLEFPLRMFCFDVMFLNGSDVMAKPLSERRQILERIVVKGGRILLTDSIRASSAEQISRFFDESVSQGLEGIIAKDLHAPYVAGARKFAWIKLKRSYKGELSDTVDVVVVGYFSGQGKRTQFGLGGLLSAVYNREQERFESIAKIGTGMTEQMLSDLEETLSKSKRKSKPGNVVCNIEPDFWVEPKMVLEVRADEITKSPIHTAGADDGPEGFALRFPRLVKIRDDKGPTDITTVEEIKKMFSLQGKQPVDAGVASEES